MQTALPRPHLASESAPRGIRKAIIITVFLTVLFIGAGGIALWLCRRKRDRKHRTIRYPYVRRHSRHSEDAEQQVEWSDSSNEFIVADGRAKLPDSTFEATFRYQSDSNVSTTPPDFLRVGPLSPIVEAPYESSSAAPTLRRSTIGSTSSFTSSHTHQQRGIAQADTPSIDSVLILGALTIDSTRSSQRPIKSDGPWPLPRGRSSFVAAMERARPAMFQPDPIVNEHFEGPKHRGLLGSENGESFDWRRCSFATDEERAMWISETSEGDGVADGHSNRGTPVTSYDSQHARLAVPFSSASHSVASGKRRWQSLGLNSFGTVDEGAMWLCKSQDEMMNRRLLAKMIAGDELDTPTTRVASCQSSSHTLGSSRTSSLSSIDSFASKLNPRPVLGINTAVKRYFHQNFTSATSASPVESFACSTPDIKLTDLKPLEPIYARTSGRMSNEVTRAVSP